MKKTHSEIRKTLERRGGLFCRKIPRIWNISAQTVHSRKNVTFTDSNQDHDRAGDIDFMRAARSKETPGI